MDLSFAEVAQASFLGSFFAFALFYFYVKWDLAAKNGQSDKFPVWIALLTVLGLVLVLGSVIRLLSGQ